MMDSHEHWAMMGISRGWFQHHFWISCDFLFSGRRAYVHDAFLAGLVFFWWRRDVCSQVHMFFFWNLGQEVFFFKCVM